MARKPWWTWDAAELKHSTEVPAGYRIDYYEKPHGNDVWRKYLIDGEPCVSVTEILGLLDDGKSGGMAYAAGRIWLKGLCTLVGKVRVDWDDVRAVEAELKSRKLLHTDVWGEKASTGTDIHTILEELCEGKVPSLADLPPEQRKKAQSLCAFWADHDPDVQHSEILLGSRRNRYSGRCDLIYGRSGKTIALDAKTSAAVRPSYALQLRGYADAYEEGGYGVVDEMEVLWLRDDGYTVVPCRASSQQWQAIVNAYHAFETVKQEAKAA